MDILLTIINGFFHLLWTYAAQMFYYVMNKLADAGMKFFVQQICRCIGGNIARLLT